jgi:hypothetical protein
MHKKARKWGMPVPVKVLKYEDFEFEGKYPFKEIKNPEGESDSTCLYFFPLERPHKL